VQLLGVARGEMLDEHRVADLYVVSFMQYSIHVVVLHARLSTYRSVMERHFG
jgi:hypothetical protein